MEKINGSTIQDRIIISMIIITLLMIVLHLYTQIFSHQNTSKPNWDDQLQIQKTDSVNKVTDSIWENTEFMEN